MADDALGFRGRASDAPFGVADTPPVMNTGDGGRPLRNDRTGGSTTGNVITFPDVVTNVIADAEGKLLAFEDYAGASGANWIGLAVLLAVIWFLTRRG